MTTIEFDVDHARRTTIVRYIGHVDGPMLLEQLPPQWNAHPEIAGYHSVSDMTRYDGDIDYYDIRDIASAWQAFCGSRDAGTCTAVVSLDPLATLFVRAIALVFPKRNFAVFRTVDAALRWIATHG